MEVSNERDIRGGEIMITGELKSKVDPNLGHHVVRRHLEPALGH